MTGGPSYTAHGQQTYRADLLQQLIVAEAYRQEEKFAYRNSVFSQLLHLLEKIMGPTEVCALCTEKMGTIRTWSTDILQVLTV
jgi:hypothetical protein